MFFGVTIEDITAVSQLIDNNATAIQHAPVEFQRFSDDLLLATPIFRQLEQLWRDRGQLDDDETREFEASHTTTVQAVIMGMWRSLERLQSKLEKHVTTDTVPKKAIDHFWFRRDLDNLRRRLQFHMSSSQVIVQNMSLGPDNRIAQALGVIRQAQEEQAREDEELVREESLSRTTRDSATTSGQDSRSISLPEAPSAPSRRTSDVPTSQAGSTISMSPSLDALIDSWRQQVQGRGTGVNIGPDRQRFARPFARVFRLPERPAKVQRPAKAKPMPKPKRTAKTLEKIEETTEPDLEAAVPRQPREPIYFREILKGLWRLFASWVVAHSPPLYVYHLFAWIVLWGGPVAMNCVGFAKLLHQYKYDRNPPGTYYRSEGKFEYYAPSIVLFIAAPAYARLILWGLDERRRDIWHGQPRESRGPEPPVSQSFLGIPLFVTLIGPLFSWATTAAFLSNRWGVGRILVLSSALAHWVLPWVWLWICNVP